MLEKLKNLLNNIRSGIIYIITPILVLFGYIFYLKEKNDELEETIDEKTSSDKIANLMAKKEKEDNEATIAEGDYDTLRNEYLKQSGISSTKSDTDPQSKD